MDIGNLPDGGVVLDADQFVVSRGGTARRIQGVRLVRTDISGNALLSGDPIITAGKKLRIGNTPALGGDGGDTTFLYTGDDALVVRNAADSATLFRLSSTGAGAVTGTLNITGALTQANNQVWHAGNFLPGNYAPLAGAAFTGDVNVAGTIRASTNVLVGGAGNPVWHAGNFAPGNYMPIAGGSFTGSISITSAGDEKIALIGTANPYIGFYGATTATRYGYIQSSGGDLVVASDSKNVRLFAGGAEKLAATLSGVIVQGALNSTGAITQAGNQVWHAGNFAPSQYANLAGATFSGPVGAQSFTIPGVFGVTGSAFTSNVTSTFNAAVSGTSFNASGAMAAGTGMTVGGFPVWHQGNFAPSSYAPLASPTFTGLVRAPTQGAGNNDTLVATTAFVQSAVGAAGAGVALLSGANFTGALQQGGNNVYHSGNLNPALYAPLAGATFTGAIRRDANHYLDMAGAVPVHVFDTNDYIQYDRTNNKFGFVIGGTLVASIDSGGTLRVAGNVIGATAP